jgi:hypothetical protein
LEVAAHHGQQRQLHDALARRGRGRRKGCGKGSGLVVVGGGGGVHITAAVQVLVVQPL